LLQPRPAPAPPFVERLRTAAGRRALAIGCALLIEGLLLLLLLSLGTGGRSGDKAPRFTVVSLSADDVAEEGPATPEPEQTKERPAPQRPAPERPQPLQPAEPQPAPAPIMPSTQQQLPAAAPPASPARPAPSGKLYGPPDTRRSSASRDTERVGTAPNGEPLYAAAWYREPGEQMLRGYLSTARGPGWGLIACRTAPDYRVEDCVGLGEYPEGSQITRAVLAAAWEFKVRPPQLGGRPLVGSWVRIRIDYGERR
jgi:protein TonB